MFFIDDDEAEVFERSKHGAPRADHDPRPARLNLVPLVVPLPFGQMTVQNGNDVLRFREAAFKTLDGLRRERNFRNKDDCGFPPH